MLNIRIAIGDLVLLDLDLWRREEPETECEGCDECRPPAREPVGFRLEQQ